MRRLMLASGVVALVVAAAPAGAKLSKKASFDVQIAATQQVSWTKDTEFHLCGDGIGTQGGHGSADLTFDIGPGHRIEARRVPGESVATLQFDGKLGPVQAIGRLERFGQLQGTTTKQPSGYCPKPEPAQDDCGTLSLPPDAQLGLSYVSPSAWTTSGYLGHPKSMSLVLSGPVSRTFSGAPFKFCPGVTGDDSIGGVWAAFNHTPSYVGPAPLPLSLLFGKRKHFKVHWHGSDTDDQFAAMLALPAPYIKASFPIQTSVDWTVRFTRRARPRGAS